MSTPVNLEPADLATLQRARSILDEMLGDTDLAGDTSPEFRACQALSEILQAAPSPIPPNPFGPGDVVQLNSGGERFTVTASNAETTWITYWDQKLMSEELPTACLRLFEEGEAGE